MMACHLPLVLTAPSFRFTRLRSCKKKVFVYWQETSLSAFLCEIYFEFTPAMTHIVRHSPYAAIYTDNTLWALLSICRLSRYSHVLNNAIIYQNYILPCITSSLIQNKSGPINKISVRSLRVGNNAFCMWSLLEYSFSCLL